MSRKTALSVSEVAQLFGVNAKTVSRWASQGKIKSFRTLGGHRRFYSHDVLELFNKGRAGEGVRASDTD